MKLKAACIQINSQNDIKSNIDRAEQFINEAVQKGADFIALPENIALMSATTDETLAKANFMEDSVALQEFCRIAHKVNKFLLIGSLHIKDHNSKKLFNRSFLINGKGEVVSYYDKIHLFNVDIANGESHRESERFNHGGQACVAKTPWGYLGMTVCYDVRFPKLYRDLAKNGAWFITVPSAFTQVTGEAHWHVLLRARAIENSCYIIAPAQTGKHPSGRQTFGHSLIIDPWGRVLADAGTEEGIIIAEIDSEVSKKIRQELPSLQHDREYD